MFMSEHVGAVIMKGPMSKTEKEWLFMKTTYNEVNKLAGADMGIIIYFSAFCGAFLLDIIARIYEGM